MNHFYPDQKVYLPNGVHIFNFRESGESGSKYGYLCNFDEVTVIDMRVNEIKNKTETGNYFCGLYKQVAQKFLIR